MQQFSLVLVPHSTRKLRLDQVSKFGEPNNQPVRRDNKPFSKIPVRVTNRITIITSRHTVNFNNLINVNIKTSPSIGESSIPSFFLSNVCHITNKVNKLAAFVSIYDPSVVMITESWLSEDIPDVAVQIGNKYNMFRRDRKSPGGGVIAYVNKRLHAKCMAHLEEESKEVIWLLLKPPRMPRPYNTVAVAIVYYPPGQSAEQAIDMIEYLTTCIDNVLCQHPSSGIVIGGDFNQLKLKELCNRFNLKRSVTKPTRGQNTLDRILTNMLPFLTLSIISLQ